jgi:hypothetical protein
MIQFIQLQSAVDTIRKQISYSNMLKKKLN